MKAKLLWVFSFFILSLQAQDIYVVNSINEIKVINVPTLGVTNLVTVDILEVGYITDIAFTPNGSLYAITNGWQIFEIDLANGEATLVADLPTGNPYTALVSNSDDQLFTSRIFAQELYSYDLNTDSFEFIDNNISTPGDFTFYKGNLIYPNIFNDFIKAYDGNDIIDIGCSIPLLYTFVNDFVDCETNNIYAFDEFANLYSYTLETESFELIAEFFNETGLLNGGATLTEWMASDCPLEPLETVLCLPLGIKNFNQFGIALKSNPVERYIEFELTIPMDLTFSLFDIEGRLVKEGIVNNNSILASQLNSGIYLLQLQNRAGFNVFEGKIIKK
jgi:hypothetical protein